MDPTQVHSCWATTEAPFSQSLTWTLSQLPSIILTFEWPRAPSSIFCYSLVTYNLLVISSHLFDFIPFICKKKKKNLFFLLPRFLSCTLDLYIQWPIQHLLEGGTAISKLNVQNRTTSFGSLSQSILFINFPFLLDSNSLLPVTQAKILRVILDSS